MFSFFFHYFVENDDKNSEVVVGTFLFYFDFDMNKVICSVVCCRIFFPQGGYDDKRKSILIALSDRRKRMAAGTVFVNLTCGNVFSGFDFCDDF